jgi:hypothetical protein
LFDSIFCWLYFNLSLATGCDKQCMKQQKNRIGMFKSEKNVTGHDILDQYQWYAGAISMIYWSNIKVHWKKRAMARRTDWEKIPIVLTS